MSGMGMVCEACRATTSDRWVMKVRKVDDQVLSVWFCESCAKTREWPGKAAEFAAQR